jgi:hypothetical protein
MHKEPNMNRNTASAGFLSIVTVLGLFPISNQQTSTTLRREDPAVAAYTTFVQGKKLTVPVDREFVVAALDRLVSALEGVALSCDVASADGLDFDYPLKWQPAAAGIPGDRRTSP